MYTDYLSSIQSIVRLLELRLHIYTSVYMYMRVRVKLTPKGLILLNKKYFIQQFLFKIVNRDHF